MSGYARMVTEVSDNGIKALPGGQLIAWLTGLGDQLKRLPPGLTVLFEGPRRLQHRSHIIELGLGDAHADGLSVFLGQTRLGIEAIHLGHAAVPVEENHTACTRPEVPRGQSNNPTLSK